MNIAKNIDKEYRVLIERGEKRRRLVSFSYFLVYIASISLFYGVDNKSHIYEFTYIAPTVLGFVLLIVASTLHKKSKSLEFNPQQKLFYAFYRTADVIDDYIREQNSKNKKSAIFHIQMLSRFISNWFTDKTPITLRDTPEKIRNYLDYSVSMIESNNTDRILFLKEALYVISVESFDKDLTIDHLNGLRNSLKNLVPESVVSVNVTVKYYTKIRNKVNELLRAHSKWKYIVLGFVSFSLYVISRPYVPTQDAQSVDGISGVGLTIIGLIIYLYDRDKKKTNSKNNESSENEKNHTKSYDIEIPPFAAQYIDNPYVEPREYVASKDRPVIWQNNDEVEHSITSGRRRKISNDNDVGDDLPDGLFDKILAPHNNFEFKFDKEGIYHYYCKIHKCSEATIIVK